MLQALKNKFMQPMEKLLKEEIKIIFPRIKVTSAIDTCIMATEFIFQFIFSRNSSILTKAFSTS